MLNRLIEELRSGASLDPTALARRLDTSPEMINAMVEHLKRIGVLDMAQVCSERHCNGCPLAANCHPVMGAKLWNIKG